MTAVAVATVMAVLATMAVDRIAGIVVSDPTSTTGLIFHPHSTVTYHTTEFSFTATTNALGFRDREFPPVRSAVCRVLAIGDSFTFGWGVSLEESWPKVLEATLRQAGTAVEVANLGFPGGSPLDYANIATRAVPILQPDLVIVAVLQGDDLDQLRGAGTPPEQRRWLGRVLRVLRKVEETMYPHLTMLVGLAEESLHHSATSILVNTTWKDQARARLTRFSPAAKTRYERIDAGVRRAFEAGDLNPSLVISAIRRPESFIETFDLDRLETQRLVEQMSAQLGRIRRTAEAARATVMVVSVPFGVYVSQPMFETWHDRYGFELDRRMLTSDSPDEAIRRAAAGAGLALHTVTPAFRARRENRLYFELDGHLDAGGHRFYAEQLAPAVGAALQALPRRCAS